MLLKVQSVKHMLLLLEKMQFTVLTVMKTQLSKVLFILGREQFNFRLKIADFELRFKNHPNKIPSAESETGFSTI
jgi:hypothetical protein